MIHINPNYGKDGYYALDIDTGEIVHEFQGFEYRWYDDGKRRAKKWLRNNGYEFVKAEDTRDGLIIWVKQL